MEQKAVNQNGSDVVMSNDMLLFYLVGIVLAIFYFVITWILTGAEKDKMSRLSKLKWNWRSFFIFSPVNSSVVSGQLSVMVSICNYLLVQLHTCNLISIICLCFCETLEKRQAGHTLLDTILCQNFSASMLLLKSTLLVATSFYAILFLT